MAFGRLASPFELMKDHYQVVVVGSGYGGSIVASRLARAGQEVCVLEQGRELQPGEYPSTLAEAGAELQVDMPEFHLGSRTGLYQVVANPDINVFKGCGLGGTSLVNANVAIEPEARVFDQPAWPDEIRREAADAGSLLARCYGRARTMLGCNEYPGSTPDLNKLRALQASAEAMSAPLRRPLINVTFADGVSEGGVRQSACVRCGDCVTGCNHGAKNTTLMNYLPDAVRHGAVIFTTCAVRHLSREGDRWAVWYQRLDTGQEAFTEPPVGLGADIVVLAGGALGSTEILLRSRRRGLSLSDRLGTGFSANGDVLGFGYDVDRDIDGMGWGPRRDLPVVGPCITGAIDLGHQPELHRGMLIEEGSVPGPLATLMPEVLGVTEAVGERPGEGGLRREVDEALDGLRSVFRGPHAGALRRTQTYLVMTHDSGDGRMTLEDPDERLRIHWPGLAGQPFLGAVHERLEQATRPLGGTYVPNPLERLDLLGTGLITVHPLGGCAMGATAADGVVDHRGRVFAGPAGTDVHPGLLVADGALVPVPLGVNPLLTISALAERAAARLAEERGWTIDYDSSPPLETGPARVGAELAERWHGRLDGGEELSLSWTVAAADLPALLADPVARAAVRGGASLTDGATTRQFEVEGVFAAAAGVLSYDLSLTGDASIRLEAHRTAPEALSVALERTGQPASTGTLRRDADDVRRALASIRVTGAGRDDRPRHAAAFARLLHSAP